MPVTGTARSGYAEKVIRESIQIPCGQCIGCRLDYSRQWANRCMLELPYHDQSWFVTLTYDDEHLPAHWYADSETGEAHRSFSLCKRDFQLFVKRLRKEYKDDCIRYFAAGEYGDQSYRPHYHAILYGLHLDDLEVYKRSSRGDMYYTSDRLSRVWARDGSSLGYVVIGEVNWSTCAYVARYVTKKLKGQSAAFYELYNLEPPFMLSSRRPAIGRRYYDDHIDKVRRQDYIDIGTADGGRHFRPPKYFDRLLDREYSDELAAIKQHRQRLAIDAQELKSSGTSLSTPDLLKVEEEFKERQIKALRREL